MHDYLIDLTRDGLVMQASDEYLNPAERLLHPADPISDPGRPGRNGAWLDGWETRRVRPPGHQWAIARLGRRGLLRHVVVDTTHVTASLPAACSIEAIDLPGDPGVVDLVRNRSLWHEVVARSEMRGGGRHTFDVIPTTATHLRLVIYPDGGVARLRALGDPLPPNDLADLGSVDLASLDLGAQVVEASDARTSSPNLMLESGEAANHTGGWVTRRRRVPGNEWAIIRLAGPGTIERLEVDTRRYPGDAPHEVAVMGVDAPEAEPADLREAEWQPILPLTEVVPDTRNRFDDLLKAGAVTHLRLDLHPDGAVARFRAYGSAETRSTEDG